MRSFSANDHVESTVQADEPSVLSPCHAWFLIFIRVHYDADVHLVGTIDNAWLSNHLRPNRKLQQKNNRQSLVTSRSVESFLLEIKAASFVFYRKL